MVNIFIFISGAIVGSFLNVVGLRWDGRNFGGRSKCPKCHKVLEWWELIPIISFILLRRKCSNCGHNISWLYPLIEIWTGLIFVTVPVILIPVFCIYVVITIYDLKHKIIPDSLVYTAIALSFLSPLFIHQFTFLDWLAGPIIFAFFGLIWLLSRGRAMGFGDAKLGLSTGILLGIYEGISAIVLAFWIGFLLLVLYFFVHKIGFLKSTKELTMKSEIPFAPFIILGTWVSMVFHINLFHVALF